MFFCPPQVGFPCGNSTSKQSRVFSDFVAAGVERGRGGWIFWVRGGVGGAFSDFLASGRSGLTIFRFCGFRKGWVEHFEILWFQGEVGGLFSDFLASERGG